MFLRDLVSGLVSVAPCGPLIRPSGTFSPLGRRGFAATPPFPSPLGEKVARQGRMRGLQALP